MVGSVHDDIIAVGVVDGLRRNEFHGGDIPNLIPPARIDVLPDDLIHTHTQRLCHACLTVQDTVEYLRSHLILIVGDQKFVPALLQVGLSRPHCSGKGGYGIAFLIPPVCRKRLILKDDEEAPCDGFPGTYAADQVFIILLERKAALICLQAHLLPQGFQMPVDVCTPGQDFELELHGAYL